ncbi:uncharacterized protein LOC107046275 [Diachasma alloeum]|uniref:uncharacterized protein LOC107046275 n=1 Tax=Diachasma alloeum TaxID=454923 RepID=UPI000738109E|nr:uncharacterized protein LOC107046275 [Diachasma alloeum]
MKQTNYKEQKQGQQMRGVRPKDSELETDDTSSVADSRGVSQGRRRKRESPGYSDKKPKKSEGVGTALPAKTPDPPENNRGWEIVKEGKKVKRTPKTSPNTHRSGRRTGKSGCSSEALIVRPKDKVKYAEILTSVKRDVPSDQALGCVDKIHRIATGGMLIVLTKDSASKAQVLQTTIAGLLGEEAEVLSKGSQLNIKIEDLDDTTTKEKILAALCKTAGNEVQITLDAIKALRKAYEGKQTALVAILVPIAKKILGGHRKIRIGWVNYGVRKVERPVKCFKCWHYGHLATKYTSTIDRSQLCVICSTTGHKASDCTEQPR